jgi:hypothetical protein
MKKGGLMLGMHTKETCIDEKGSAVMQNHSSIAIL